MTKMTRSSETVFRDLGFGRKDAEHLRHRSAPMVAIRQLMADQELTQSKAATLFGVTQPRMSDLLRGKIVRFSIDGLGEMLGRAGIPVEMRIVASRTGRATRVA